MKYLLIAFLFAFFALPAIGQTQDYSLSGKSIPELKASERQFQTIPKFKIQALPLLKTNTNLPQNTELNSSVLSTPKAWKYEDLAFFCRLEVKMEKAAKFPIKVRLGEVQYVEKMEGKY